MTLFTEEELFVLANTVGAVELFGVPELSAHRFNQETSVPKGIKRLEEKELLNEGSLTKKGFMVASLIERYDQADSYLCLDKTYYVAPGKEAILLKKMEEGFQLTIQEPESILGLWLSEYMILRREGTEKEKEFNTRRARISLEDLQQQGIDAAFVIGRIQKHEKELTKVEYGFFLLGDILYRLDNVTLKRVSQFWLNKWLVDSLKIPYVCPEIELKKKVNWFE